jgi:hypothetical protein
MSNNPFLKSKESNNKSNNRFQFLEPDETDNKPKKERKVISKYDSTDNSFTKPSIRRDDRRDDRRGDYNNYKNRPTPQKQPEPVKEVIIDLTTEFFPDLVPTKNETVNITQQPKSSLNFKDIVNTKIIPETLPEEDEIINPGWVKISKSKTSNELIWKYGPSTEYEKKINKQEELENDINYCMNRSIETMKYRWAKYKEEYDELNGEGAYDEKFTLSPVYGSEYDTEDEEEYDNNNYDSYDE